MSALMLACRDKASVVSFLWISRLFPSPYRPAQNMMWICMVSCTIVQCHFCYSAFRHVALPSIASQGRKNAAVPTLISVMLTYWYKTDDALFCANSFSSPLSLTQKTRPGAVGYILSFLSVSFLGIQLNHSVKTIGLFNMAYKTKYGYSISLPRGQGACIWYIQRFSIRRIVAPVFIEGELQKRLWRLDDESYLPVAHLVSKVGKAYFLRRSFVLVWIPKYL